MARRTTGVLTGDDEQALKRASRAEGLSQSELIRKGLRSPPGKSTRPLVGWLKLSRAERDQISSDKWGDYDR